MEIPLIVLYHEGLYLPAQCRPHPRRKSFKALHGVARREPSTGIGYTAQREPHERSLSRERAPAYRGKHSP